MPPNTPPRSSRRVPDLGIPDALVQLSFLVYEALAAVAQDHDVPVQQARLLGVLRDREPGMAQLAALLELDKSSTTGLVARAERRGLVRRLAVPEDRRAVRVVLTEEGMQLASAFRKEVDQGISALVAGLTETNRKRLTQLATQVVVDQAERRSVELAPDTPTG